MAKRKLPKQRVDYEENKYYYNNIEGLRRAGLYIERTPEEEIEYQRCSTDIYYFIENYCHIITIDKGLQLMKLYPYQKEAINNIIHNRLNIFCWGRRMGKTTTASAIFLWLTIFTDYYRIGCYADKDDDAISLVQIYQTMYMNLPMHMQKGIEKFNEHEVKLENKSYIMARPTSATSGRSKGFNFLYIDEASLLRDNIWSFFWAGVSPTISSGTTSRMLITSTPNGLNHFYELCHRAERGLNDFVYKRYTWRSHPDKTEEWANAEIRQFGKRSFMQEHECEFFGSARTLIEGTILKTLFDYVRTDYKIVEFICKSKYNYTQYDEPQYKHKYIACVDMGEGLGQDFTVINIIDVTSPIKYKQVAIFKCDTISLGELPYIIQELAVDYNMALVIAENNCGSEALGNLVDKLEYPNVFMHDDGRYGFRLNMASKKIGLQALKDIVEKRKLEIYDVDTLNEFSHFVEVANSYKADKDAHDDIIMSLNTFALFLTNDLRFRLYIADIDYTKVILDINTDETQSADLIMGLLGNVDMFAEERKIYSIEAKKEENPDFDFLLQ